MEQPKSQLPTWAMVLVRLIVHPEFQEEIEGDLLENYQTDCQKYGLKAAERRLLGQLLSLCKPNLIINLNRHTMNRRNWFILLIIAIGIVAASISPFLPGPNNGIVHGFAKVTHLLGYVGLIFVPLSLVWLIVEIRNKRGQKPNRWTNGYYPSLLAMTPMYLFLPMQIAIGMRESRGINWELLLISVFITAFFTYRIQKLKSKIAYKFNPAPVFVVSIPLIALFTYLFVVEKAADRSREYVIFKTEPLITAIEEFKTERGFYPEKLEELEGKYIPEIPRVNSMGVRAYQYEKRNGAYQLSFEQNWHWNATDVVVYHPLGPDAIKGSFEKKPVGYSNWFYWLAD
jgi:hypothetical protein